MPEARQTDPETSHSAAASVLALREKQRDVWAVLVAIGPSTDTALVEAYQKMGSAVAQQSESGIRTRRHEMTLLGYVRPVVDSWGDEIKEQLPSGRWAIVWEARP